MLVKKVGYWCAALLLALIPAALSAQEEPGSEPTTTETDVNEAGIPVGAFIFSPTLELMYQWKDNIFLQRRGCEEASDGTPLSGKCDDQVWIARPRLMLELPVAENYFRFVYMPQYRDYKEYPFEENWSHFLDFQAVVDSPSGFQLKIDNRLVRGVLETIEFDPGREVFWGDEPFFKDRARVRLGYAFTETDSAGIDASYTVVEFDDPTSIFYNYETLEGAAMYSRAMGPLLGFDVRVGVSKTDIEDTHDVGGHDTRPDSDGWFVRGGLNGEITQNLSGDISVGYERLEFDQVDQSMPGESDEFSGLTVDTRLQYGFAEGSSLELELSHGPRLSNYDNNSFYESTHAGLNLEINVVGRLFATAGGFWQTNSYDHKDSHGITRDDDILRATLGVGYHFTDYLAVRANYRYEDRDSNVDFEDGTCCSYKANTLILNLTLGY